MRPSKSCTDMELSSVKKKFKDKKFAAGCSREVIKDGAALLGWELDTLIQKTLLRTRRMRCGCAHRTPTRMPARGGRIFDFQGALF